MLPAMIVTMGSIVGVPQVLYSTLLCISLDTEPIEYPSCSELTIGIDLIEQ
jgi:hypothetical protein